MIGRPRCREWTPLATQQLRLRSLIQILGYNIRPPEWCTSPCSFYVTLHHTTMCAPFYTSERISSPHPKWKEIDSEITQRVSSSNIVIRIWCHIIEPCETGDRKPQDLVIQTWGVYFSGLRYIGANLALNFTSDCFKSNTLVFQMHGGYFCSYKSLKLDIIPPENETEHGSLSSDSSGKTNLSKITLESKFIQQNKLKGSRSVSPHKYSKIEKEYSKSQSPIEKGFKQNHPTLKTSASLNIRQTQRDTRRRDDSVERKAVDPNYIYEHSPNTLDVIINENCDKMSKNTSQEELNSQIDLSETAESYDLRNETYGCPKYRYMALGFLKSEIRPSYNATKLQKLHLLQYSIKKRQEAVQEIKERIYKKSALANDLSRDDEVKVKCRSKSQRNLFSPEEVDKTPIGLKNGKVKEERPSNGPRLTLKLNDLLSIKAKPSPFQRAEHVRLTKQMEILRFKRIILADERDSKLASIRRLKARHAKQSEENQDVGSELMQAYHTLCKRWEEHRSLTSLAMAMRDSAASSHRSLQERRASLLQQLRDVFCIQQQAESRVWTVCEVPFPALADARAAAACEPVAAGYVAQAVTVAAAILHQPLRYKIILLGSASKVVDIIPDLPDPNIPLYPRGGDVTLFRYGLFLLNKCLSQLVWSRHLPSVDMNTAHSLQLLLSRSHLPDLSKLYGLPTAGLRASASDGGATKAHSLRSLVHKQDAQFNRFKYSSSGQSPLSAAAADFKRHRLSRSVGSYNDDQEISVLDASTTSIMGSEPNIFDAKLNKMSSQLPAIQKHSSESEISRLSEHMDGKIVFSLGEDEVVKIESDQLVKISSNNEDECSSCLEQICTEINDFCNVEDTAKDLDVTDKIDDIKTIDIAKHMERKSEIEDGNLCESCEHNKEGECGLVCANTVSDVVVIPSAEASLDTGQVEVDPSEKYAIASGEN